jgi:large subunit ribosomal protein L6
MSRIGKLPIAIPSGVNVEISEQGVQVTGKLGKLATTFTGDVHIAFDSDDNKKILVKPANDTSRARAMWGLSRSIINNMVTGVSEGFTIRLEINGVGYRAAVDGKILTLFLGFSHEIKYAIPEGIDIKCEKPTLLVIFGADRQKVGQVAAVIRALRPPEPYKGKGIKYETETIRRKVGKKK